MHSKISRLCTLKHHQKDLSYAIYLLIDSIRSDYLHQLGFLFLGFCFTDSTDSKSPCFTPIWEMCFFVELFPFANNKQQIQVSAKLYMGTM